MKRPLQGLADLSLIFAAFLPPLLLAVLINNCWVNIPVWDDWDTPGLFLKEYFVQGHFSWRLLFAQHNESRLVVPKLLNWVVAHFSGWNIRVMLAMTWLTAVAIFAQLLWLLRKTVRASATVRWCFAVALSAVLFSPNQSENWLMSIQLVVFLPPLCLISCLVVQHSSLAYRTKVIMCALLSLVSTFSNSNGILCWILGAPLPWLSHKGPDGKPTGPAKLDRVSLTWTAIYLLGLIATALVYFWDYTRPPWHPAMGSALRNPVEAAQYFIAWLGNPFCRGMGFDPLKSAFALGLCVSAVLVIFLLAIWRRLQWISSGHGWIQLHPWAVLTLYGLVSGLVTVLGRVGFGIEQAISVRYIGFSCYVYLGLIGLSACLSDTLDDRSPATIRRWTPAWIAGAVLCFTIFVPSWLDGRAAFHWRRIGCEEMKLAIRFLSLIPLNPALARVYPDPDHLRQIAIPLIEKEILQPGLVGSWPLQKIQEPDGDDSGWFTVKRGPAGCKISGWSIISDQDFSPGCVLVTTTDAGNRERLETAAILSWPVRARGTGYLCVSGFNLDLPSASFPQAAGLKLYSADLKRQKLFRLIEREGNSEVPDMP